MGLWLSEAKVRQIVRDEVQGAKTGTVVIAITGAELGPIIRETVARTIAHMHRRRI